MIAAVVVVLGLVATSPTTSDCIIISPSSFTGKRREVSLVITIGIVIENDGD
jgi:hypothetical protein